MQHKTITTQNGTVHYWIDKKTSFLDWIVFTHGVTADHTMFEKQIDFFSGKYNILLWDIPMHGLSKPYKNFSYRDTVKIIHSIFQKEYIEQAIFVGMSMGGYPCQHFAALYPNMVKCFIALDTTPLGLQYYSNFDLWCLRQVAPIAKLFPANFLRKSMAWSISKTNYSYQKMMDILSKQSKKEIVEQMKVAYEFFSIENQQVTFSFPVIILVGEYDSTGKVKTYCKKWADNTGYPLHIIKNAKHFSNGDNPEQVNQEIMSFIEEIKNRSSKQLK